MTEMREKEGGTYGVIVVGDLYDLPQERFIFQVNFDADPIKRKRLIQIVYQEIEKLKNAGPLPEELNTIKNADLKDAQEMESKKNANYWLNKQGVFLQYGKDFDRDMRQILSGIDTKKVQDFARQIFDQGNLIEVVMNPEQ